MLKIPSNGYQPLQVTPMNLQYTIGKTNVELMLSGARRLTPLKPPNVVAMEDQESNSELGYRQFRSCLMHCTLHPAPSTS